MRKVEVVVPKGKGRPIASIANHVGAYESIVLNAHGPKVDKDIVSISAPEHILDELIDKIKTYCQRNDIQIDLRIWSMETPLTKKERDRTVPFEELKANAYHSSTIDFIYLVLIALSAVLSALGLLMDSAIVIIGAMIIAPVLKPIMTASLGTVSGDFMLLLRGLGALLVGICVGLAAVFLMGFMLPFTETTPLLLAVSQMNILMIGIALVAGIIAAVSMVSNLSENLAGVSIAVALMPPIAAVALNAFRWFMGSAPFTLFGSATMVLIINCLAINIGGTLVFYASGFRSRGKAMLTKELGIAIVLFLIFSVPFVYLAYQSYGESITEKQVNGIAKELTANATIQSIRIKHAPLEVELVLISKENPPENLETEFREELRQIDEDAQARVFYIKTK